jgi:hypothetical protein
MTISVAKFRLKTPAAIDEFFQNASLVGIASRQKEYQLCWEINRLLGFRFKMNNDLEVVLMKKEKKCFFTVYEFDEPARFTIHYLYNNHYKGEYLLQELKNMDFVWLIKGTYYNEEEIRWLAEGIRSIQNVQLVTLLKAEGLKNRENLIL